jgi:hypothetical protein
MVMNNSASTPASENDLLENEYENAEKEFFSSCFALGDISDPPPPLFSSADLYYKKAAEEVPLFVEHFRSFRKNHSLIEYTETLQHNWIYRQNILKAKSELDKALNSLGPDNDKNNSPS